MVVKHMHSKYWAHNMKLVYNHSLLRHIKFELAACHLLIGKWLRTSKKFEIARNELQCGCIAHGSGKAFSSSVLIA